MNTETPLISPFQEGFSAYFRDKTPRDGPYNWGHPNRDDWQRGFAEAKREFEADTKIDDYYKDNTE